MAMVNDVISVAVTVQGAQAMSAMGGLQTQAKQTGGMFDNMASKIGIAGSTLKSAFGAGAAIMAGGGLIRFLADATTGFADAAKAAGELADATGGQVEDVSRFQAVLEDMGISADESRKMMEKFTTNWPKNADDLERLGVALQTNADGSADYAATMTLTVDAINNVGDASERNRLLLANFGKPGVDAFNELLASGLTVEEALQRISEQRIFDNEDVRKAQEYDDALDEFAASVSGLQNEIGRALLPVLTTAAGVLEGVVEGIGTAIDWFEKLPDPVEDAATALVIFFGVMKAGTAVGLWSAIATGVTMFTTSVVVMGGVIPVVTAAIEAMTAALLLNPITAVAVAIAATVLLVSNSIAQHKKQLESDVADVRALEAEGMTRAAAVRQVAEEADRSQPKGRKAVEGGFEGKELRDTIDEINTAYDENVAKMGEMEATQKRLGDSTKSLKDMLMEGGHSAEELGDNALAASEAQRDLADATDQAEGMIKAYASSTWDASEATESMFDAAHALADSQRDLKDAVKEFNEEPTAENLQNVAEQLWDTAEASQAAWLAEEQRYGRYPSQEAQDAHKLQALQDALESIGGGAAGAQAAEEFAAAAVAYATEHPTSIPVGWTIEDIDAAIAVIKQQIEDEEDPEVKAQLNLDVTTLETWKSGVGTTVQPVPVEASVTPESTQIIEGMTTDQSATVTYETVWSPGGYDAIKQRKDYLAEAKTAEITMNTSFTPGSHNEVTGMIDDILDADGETPDINIFTHFHDGGYAAVKSRLDFITGVDGESPDIDIWVHFNPGGYEAIANRIRFIDQDRSATISLGVNGLSALGEAERSIAALTGSTTRTVNLAQQIKLPEFPTPPTPVNLVRVSVDGTELRSVIREELGQVRRSDDLVAAMGMRA